MTLATYLTGHACRLPGCGDVDSLARALFEGRDLVTSIPESRWAHAAYLHPFPAPPGKSYTLAAGVLDDLWGFDAEVFGISPREAAQMDPQQRLLLHVVYEALEDAGLARDRLAGTEVGVYVGASTMTHGARLGHDPLATDPYVMTGNTLSLVSNRVSYALDLRGPSLTVDTACSSSLFAFNLAAMALARGEIDTAIVAGSNVLLDPIHFSGFSAARMLSPTGRSRPFSADADGYVRSEAIVAFVLERKDIASIAPRRPRAKLLGVGTNSDGHTLTAALPSLVGQTDLLRGVYETAGVDPEELSFVEAHGTGTPVGDPVEAAALGRALGAHRTRPLPIGSIKSNIGHPEPAAGAAGVLKTLIAFERNAYPRTLHANELNPNIRFDDLNLSVVRETLALAEEPDRAIRAGVSSFGFGGANAHVILEKVSPPPEAAPATPARPPVLMVSAATEDSLRRLLGRWSVRLRRDAPDAAALADLSGQASRFRALETRRAAVLCDDAATSADILDAAARGANDPRVILGESALRSEPTVFVFSGNGSQYAGMGKLASATDPVYAEKLREIDAIFSDLSGWSILDKIDSPTLDEELQSCDIAQPLLFADQVAQVAAYEARGLRPAAVMGHSGGEVAAAHVSGALALNEALALIYWRSHSQRRLRGTGTMAALQVAAEEAQESLDDFGGDIHLAADNSPRSVTLVGSNETIADYIRFARRTRRWACVKLDIDYPYHSPVQDQILDELRAAIASITPSAGTLPFVSSVTGAVEPGEALATEYWCDNVRQPVNFRAAMDTLKQMGFRAYFEIGPSPVLINYIKGCVGGDVPNAVVVAGFEKRDTIDPVGRAFARAAAHGCGVGPADLAPEPITFDRSLPRYPWASKEFRDDDTATINRVFGSGDDFHRLLGIEDGDDGMVWRSDLGLGNLPAIGDHRVGGQALFPATGFAETALAAAQRALGAEEVDLRDLDIAAPLRLNEGALMTMRTTVRRETATLQIESQPRGADAQWRTNLRSRFYAVADVPETGAAPDTARRPDDIDGDAIYDAARRIGLDYGPGFRRLSHLRKTGTGRIEVILTPAEPIGLGHEGVDVHALDLVAADAVFHGVIGALRDRQDDRHSYLPVRIGRLVLLRSGATIGSGGITIRRVGRRSVLADFALYGTDGTAVALVLGVRFQAAQLKRGVDLAEHSYRFVAQVLDRAQEAPALGLDAALTLADGAEFAPGDGGAFVIEGIAQQIVLAAARGLADAEGYVVEPRGGATPYFRSAMAILARAGLATVEDAGWRLAPTADDEDAQGLVSGLLARRPDLGAEAALLARLQAGLDEALISADVTAAGAFGRDALANLSDGAVHVARRNRLMVRMAEDIAGRWDANRQLRVAEVSDGRALLLPDLVDAPALAEAVLTEIVVPCRGEAGAAVSLPPERVDRINAAEVTGNFDLVLVPGTLDRAEEAGALAERLAGYLAPGGALMLTAQAPSDFLDLVLGLEPGWFTGTDTDGQPVARPMVADELSDLFIQTGLDDVAAAELPENLGIASLLVARKPVGQTEESAADPDVTDLIGALADGAAHPLVEDVTDAGMRIARPSGESATAIVYCEPGAPKGAETPDATLAARLLGLRDLAADLSAGPATLVALVPGGSGQPPARPVDPLQSATWAALRVMTNEYPDLRRVSFDCAEAVEGAALAARVAEHLAGADPDAEVILGPDASHGLRVVRGLAPQSETGTETAMALVPPVTGGLDELHWAATDRQAPKAGEVEVEVAATGLNYRDVMWAMGLLPEEALEHGFAGPTLGMEFSGRITRLGAGVTGLKVGDSVVAFGPASFASHRTLSTDFVARLPKTVDPEAAAAIPVAFFTAHYALVHLGRLSEGETVLIHGGAGGVGLAAIQIAQSLGARVIATAGSPVKRDLLASLGVGEVLDSRSLGFADAVMDLTGGRGVDVVLNALAGEAMEKSLNCVAPFGRFLELGKQDYYANTMVGLRPLKENIAYFGIDVDQLISSRPELATRLFAEMLDGFHEGKLRPIPYRGFDGGRVIDAFRLMQKSGHIGKIVVRPPRAGNLPVAGQGRAGFAAAPEGAHVIVGGLGGLGLEVADWLVARGARRLVLTGRRTAPGPDAQARIERWRAAGVAVALEACDIADADAVAALLDRLRGEGPIRGVMHSAMVLEDMPMAALTGQSLARTLPAKVNGAANLDRLTREDELDYFVLFSSVAAMFGNHGQSAYAAANGYLEGIARDRRAAGLPGLAIGWGAVSDAGYLARDGKQAEVIRRATGDVPFTVRDVTDSLDRLLAPGATADPVHYVSNMRWGALARTLRIFSQPTFHVLRTLQDRESHDTGGGDLRAELVSLPRRKAETRLAALLVDRIANILRVSEGSIKTTEPISNLGMDSLMGVEFGLSLEQTLGDNVPVSLISDALSIDQIARNIVGHLVSDAAGAAESDDAARSLLAKHGAGSADA